MRNSADVRDGADIHECGGHMGECGYEVCMVSRACTQVHKRGHDEPSIGKS